VNGDGARTLPKKLRRLDEMALDLHSAWNHDLDRVWRRIDPELWEASHNPWAVLRSVGRFKLEVLASDQAFLDIVRSCRRAYAESTAAPALFQRTYAQPALRGVAYFSMEFGLSEALPMYAGGLGVLAGDYLKAASDLGVPVVGIGLLYSRGYFRQSIDANGAQIEFYPPANPEDLPIQAVRDREGALVRLHVDFPGRLVHVRAWSARVGRTSLYLLDTNDPENSAPDRGITCDLYGGGEEMRLQQELILGIGGWRLIEALGITIDVCHLNEGHAAFAILERAHALMERARVPFDVALTAVRAGTIFTTHTPVAAGFDRFDPHLAEKYLSAHASRLGVGTDALLALGRSTDSDRFLPAYLAVRGSGAVNAVSRRHSEVSRQLFASLFPRWPLAEIPIGFVTNGVHTPTWDSPDADRLWTEACGKNRWRDDLSEIERHVAAVELADLWGLRMRSRGRLVEFVRDRFARQLQATGAPADHVDAARIALDPSALTIGFARRFASYKRLTLLLRDEPRLIRLLTDAQRPIQLVVAGKAHPNDPDGKALLRTWIAFERRSEVRGRVVFLSDYDMLLAEELVAGVDLWINTPQPSWEACGTSGMKVLVNGGLNFSVLDGWWAEAYTPEVGWAIGTAFSSDDAAAQDLYERLETDVIPAFYTRNADGIPTAWVERMRASMSQLTPHFSTNRMLREYVAAYYVAASAEWKRRTERRCAAARRIAESQRAMDAAWPHLRFGTPHVEANGSSYRYDLPCYLGEVDSGNVEIELYADAPLERHRMDRVAELENAVTLYRAVLSTQRPIADYTPRAIPRNDGVQVPLEATEITWLR
jgi:starch phosphorylase